MQRCNLVGLDSIQLGLFDVLQKPDCFIRLSSFSISFSLAACLQCVEEITIIIITHSSVCSRHQQF